MKTALISVAIVFVILIGGFVGYNELIKQQGEDVYLETRPVDPRDLLQGDYVILTYALEQEPLPIEGDATEGQTVWVTLSNSEPAEGIAILTHDPEELAVRATLERNNDGRGTVQLSHDRYYIPVGSGRDMPPAPWTVHFKVTESGTARIVGLLKDGELIELNATTS